MTYREIIRKQRELLPKSRNWWPQYLYHFTDIKNAIGIIEKGWIFGRQMAIRQELMKNDNASNSVISLSSESIKEYARLYFRPKTPTQYHNEGYKPEIVRKSEINASCPVPIFFCLDTESVLQMSGVGFSELSCAGNTDLNLLTGEDSFSQLPFDKIYHDGPFEVDNRDDIIKHRHAEVIRIGGIPIKGCLKAVVCRSPAERQTLLYILRTQYKDKYLEYRNLVKCGYNLDMFFNNGIFVRDVSFNNQLRIDLNYKDMRRRYCKTNTSVKCKIIIDYIGGEDRVVERNVHETTLDYLESERIILHLQQIPSRQAVVEIFLDEILMYKNQISLSSEDLV